MEARVNRDAMESKGVTLRVGSRNLAGRLAVPGEPCGTGVLVLPGASHGPFGGVFDRFVEAAVDAGCHALRYESWDDRSDLTDMTEAQLHDDVAAGLQFLRWYDCSTVVIVAKGFGARIALTRGAADADRMVLWSPAVLVDAETTGPTIAPSALASIDVPVRLLHAEADEVVSVDTAADVVRHLPSGELVELGGEDHLYDAAPARVVERTMAFFDDPVSATRRH